MLEHSAWWSCFLIYMIYLYMEYMLLLESNYCLSLKLVSTENCLSKHRVLSTFIPVYILYLIKKSKQRNNYMIFFLEGLFVFVRVFGSLRCYFYWFGVWHFALDFHRGTHKNHASTYNVYLCWGCCFGCCLLHHSLSLLGGLKGVTSLQISVFLSSKNGLFLWGRILFALLSRTVKTLWYSPSY